jgi:hypothetical protein
MMTKNDYEVIASALRPGLTYAERIKVTRLLVPHLLADNGKFNPMFFGESMGLSKNIIKMILTNKEEVENNASTEDSSNEVGSEAARQEGCSSEDQEVGVSTR